MRKIRRNEKHGYRGKEGEKKNMEEKKRKRNKSKVI